MHKGEGSRKNSAETADIYRKYAHAVADASLSVSNRNTTKFIDRQSAHYTTGACKADKKTIFIHCLRKGFGRREKQFRQTSRKLSARLR